MPTPNAPILPPCELHGQPAEAGFRNDCWECDMEAAIAKADRDEAAR